MFQYQVETNTSLFRNQNLFKNIQILLQQDYAKNPHTSNRKPKILSFGCSTGQEALTIKTYLTESEIYACDINPTVLETAKNNFGHLGINFFMSDKNAIKKNGLYDVIFALSSLCQTTRPTDGSPIFNFDAYSSIMELFSDSLAPGGYLVIYNSSSIRMLEFIIYEWSELVKSGEKNE